MKLSRRGFFYLLALLAAAVLLLNWRSLKVFVSKPGGTRRPARRENPFTEGNRSLVSVVGGRDVKTMVREAVFRIGGFERIGVRGKAVLVKPNVVAGRKQPTTTNPEVVRAVVGLLYEEGAARVYVGDMSAMMRLPTKANMEKTGIRQAAEEAGAEVLYFEDHGWVRVALPEGRHLREVDVSEWIFRVDRVVNLPVIKTHRSARYSICLKNFVGATHFKQRPYLVDRRHWEEVVAELNMAYSPDLNIVDGTTIMVSGGPWEGKAADTDLVIASGDRVAADVVGLGIIRSFGLWPEVASPGVWQQGQIRRAVEAGLGAKSPEEIKLLTASLDESPEFEELIEKTKENIGA
jgi:uncharacterized protein (DUF362 family)